MLAGWVKTQVRNHGPFLLLALTLGCEASTAPLGTVEMAGQTRMRTGSTPVPNVDVVVVRISGNLPVSIIARAVSDSAGNYRVTYGTVDVGTCGSYFAAARRRLELGDIRPNTTGRVPCTEGAHNIDFLLSASDTAR